MQASENGKGNVSTSTPPPPPPPPSNAEKPLNDVVAGAMARAASQGTIHPLDTLKVQMQVGKRAQQACKPYMHQPLPMHVALCSSHSWASCPAKANQMSWGLKVDS